MKASGLIGCLMVLGMSTYARASEQRPEESTAELIRRGTTAEKTRRNADAITAYEELLRRDTSFEAVVAPRLVNLYIDGGQSAAALSWAARVSCRQPDPKAYLAGVHARLGQWKESELILRQSLREEREPRKRLPLMWQLADAQEGQGDGESALATLAGARDAAPDDRLRKTSAQRLNALHHRLDAAQTKQPPTRGKPKAEDTP
ncbi:MAG: hypothetical protein WCK89_02765 [bacterium]